VKQKKKKGDNDSKISSGLNTPSQSNTPDGSRRSSTSNGSNTSVSIKNVARQVESDSKSNMSSVSNIQGTSRRPSESNGSKTTSSPLSSEKSRMSNGPTHITSMNPSLHKQSSNERQINGNATTMSHLNSNGAVPSNKSSTNWAAHLFSTKDENQKTTNENSKSNVTKSPSPPVRSQKSHKTVSLTNGKPKVGGLAGNINFDSHTFYFIYIVLM
jgi:hypothetical protein